MTRLSSVSLSLLSTLLESTDYTLEGFRRTGHTEFTWNWGNIFATGQWLSSRGRPLGKNKMISRSFGYRPPYSMCVIAESHCTSEAAIVFVRSMYGETIVTTLNDVLSLPTLPRISVRTPSYGSELYSGFLLLLLVLPIRSLRNRSHPVHESVVQVTSQFHS